MKQLEIPDLTVVRVNKQCRTCKHRWRGHFFQSWVLKAPKIIDGDKQYILAYCDSCLQTWEIHQRRMGIEVELQDVDNHLRAGPTKSKKIRYMRSKVRILERLRDTHDPGTVAWNNVTDRIKGLESTIKELDK